MPLSSRPARGRRARLSNRRPLGMTALSLAACVLPSQAATYVGSAADTLWNNPVNWNPAAVPAEGDNIVIADTTAQNTLTLNDAPHTIANLQYGDTGTRITGFTITSGGTNANILTMAGGITANGAFTALSHLINSPVVIQGNQTWSVSGTSGSTIDDRGIAFTTFTNTAQVPLTLNGDVTKTGTGQVALIGRNVTGDGTITINQGAIKINGGNSTTASVTGNGAIVVNSGGSLYIARNSGSITVTKPIQVNTGGVLSVGGNNATTGVIGSPIAWSGTTTLNLNSNTAGQNMRFTGNWSGNGTINLTTAGTGANRFITLAGDNSGLNVNLRNTGVTLEIAAPGALGTGVYRADTNSTLRSADATDRTIDNIIDLAASNTMGSATTGNLTFTATGTSGSLTGFATGNAAKTLTILNARTTITGIVTGGPSANALTKAGAGILEFAGANTYNRPINVTAGTLLVSAGGQLGSPSGTNNAVIVGDAGLLQLDVAGIADAVSLTVTSTDAAPEVLLGAGVNDTLASLVVNGNPLGPGTFGSTASGAANPGLANPDDIFGGTGILTVTAPEPGTLGIGGILVCGVLARRRGRRVSPR